jgi:hypothetical protein
VRENDVSGSGRAERVGRYPSEPRTARASCYPDLVSKLASSNLQINLRSFELQPRPPSHAGPVLPLHEAWVQVAANWDDRARHDTLLGIAAERREFAWVATRYRERAGDPIANRQLERLRRAAIAVMLATATRPLERTSRNPVTTVALVFTVLVLLATAGGAYMTRVKYHTPMQPTTSAPVDVSWSPTTIQQKLVP